MKFDNEYRKFKIGDIIKVRSDLVIGRRYYTGEDKSDIFTSRMRNNRGKEGRIIGFTNVGYILDIDSIHNYTEEMFEESRDYLAELDYIFNEDVEKVLNQSQMDFYSKRIDEALDNNDEETFKRLIEELKKYKD